MTTAIQLSCACPGCPFPANRVRMNTAYVNEEDNMAALCLEHEEEAREYWEERWADYYADIAPCYGSW